MGHEITRPKSLKRGMSGWQDWQKMSKNVSYVPHSDSDVRTIVSITKHPEQANTNYPAPYGNNLPDKHLYEIVLAVNNWDEPHYCPTLYSVDGRNPVYHPVYPTVKTETIWVHGNTRLGHEANEWCFFSNGCNQRDAAEAKLVTLGL